MRPGITTKSFKQFAAQFEGEFYFDNIHKILYATDASAYREMPLAVALPKNKNDVKKLIEFASENNTSIIPRGAGTSLAGQVVGAGIVVDVSKYMNRIIEVSPDEKWVRVEPGVVLAELNRHLKQYGLMFGPETSTANRCTLGGMLGNNSCGLHSLVYGSVRNHVLEVGTILRDNSEIVFKELTSSEFYRKTELNTLEGKIYQHINQVLGLKANRDEINYHYPDASVSRRNNGYALDVLANMQPFSVDGDAFNFAKLLAGSEGTLAFTTEMKLNLVDLPPAEKALLCVHFDKLEDAFHANLIGLEFNPSAIELMDRTILDLTKQNIGANRNRFFVEGNPAAILIIELNSESKVQIENQANAIEQAMRAKGYGYAFPLVWGGDAARVWALRKAGLGVLSNFSGDAKPVGVVEDTAIPVKELPQFLSEFTQMLDDYDLQAVYHAHIATGELHLRPVLNLKDETDVEFFRKIAIETAVLVKKYHGALSGEHGDGRLRGEFIPFMLGEKVYTLLKELKHIWDADNIFNPGKIIDTPPMNNSLRYIPGQKTPELNHFFNYDDTQGLARAIEKCNGSGDCRKSEIIGGTMCPSFMATRDEMLSTRGRANIFRELATRPSEMYWADKHEIKEVLDLCLSCKACKSECPSGVDVTRLKADFLQSYYDGNTVPARSRIIANYPKLMHLASVFKPLSNIVFKSKLINIFIGFSPERSIQPLSKTSLAKWYNMHNVTAAKKKVYLFNDEFLNTTESHIGIKTILLLEKLGYEVVIPRHLCSGRTYLSKGFVRKAQKIAIQNIDYLKDIISRETPLIGIEPSAILTFRDEYVNFVPDSYKKSAIALAKNTFLIEEFIMNEVALGNIKSEQFTTDVATIKLHGHCHQKALVTTKASIEMLQLPINYSVDEIPSGCCGMAGSFGYEKEHYELSMKIGEMVLFPAVRNADTKTIIAAPGTSCRDQILHGTGRKAVHPIEVLYEALNK